MEINVFKGKYFKALGPKKLQSRVKVNDARMVLKYEAGIRILKESFNNK
jgi:hypothetical protein